MIPTVVREEVNHFMRQLAHAFGLLLVAVAAHAQSYPSKAITLVVPFPPGGIDNIVRLVTQKASERLGQAIIVENKPGASGLIAAQAVKQAVPDGYTLLLGHAGTHAVNQSLYASLPYDPINDFEPITSLFSTSHVLVVPPGSPVRSVADLIALSRSRPDGLTFASQGIGTGGHLLGEMLRTRSGAALTHVPYKGTAPAQTDVMAGRVDLYFDGLVTSLPHVRAGKLNALAMATKSRVRYLPNVPTMAEAGYPGVEMDFWFAVFAPTGTPRSALDPLHRGLSEAMRHPDVVTKLNELALDIMAGTPAQLAALVREDTARLGKVVKDAGAKAD